MYKKGERVVFVKVPLTAINNKIHKNTTANPSVIFVYEFGANITELIITESKEKIVRVLLVLLFSKEKIDCGFFNFEVPTSP